MSPAPWGSADCAGSAHIGPPDRVVGNPRLHPARHVAYPNWRARPPTAMLPASHHTGSMRHAARSPNYCEQDGATKNELPCTLAQVQPARRHGARRRPGRPGPARQRLPHQADPTRRPLPARRRHRRHRAHRAGAHAGAARAAAGDRQPRRRGRLHRHRHGGQGGARRLYRAVYAVVAHDQPRHLPQAALRHGQGLRAGRHGGVSAADPRGLSAVQAQHDRRNW